MTNSSDLNAESISPKPRRWRRILIWGGVGLGVTTIAVGTAATWFVKERLAPMIGDIVGNIVQRPVIVGPVERVTPTSIRFGPSSIPATENNPNNASTEAVDVNFSLLSLLWKPVVRLELTLVNPDVYLEENAQGEWIRTKLKLEGDPPVDIQFGKVGVRNADITLKPFITQRAPKIVGLDVEQAFVNISDENQRFRGNVNGEFDQGGTFSIRANTFLPDGKIDGRVRANQIQLSQFSDLVKVPDFALQGGAVNANLQVNLEEYALSKIQGKANLDRVQIDVADLKRPIQPINGNFRFSGTQVEIQELTTGLEDIDVDIAGTVKADPKFDLLKTQFDITTNIEPTQLSTLLDIAENIAEEKIPIPVPISGAIQTEVDLVGTVKNPTATVVVETTQATQIDKITLDNINTTLEVTTQLNDDFSLTADPKIDIKALQIQPAFGGNITGKGEVALTGLKELITPQTQPKEKAKLPLQTPPTPPALLPVPTTPTQPELPLNPDIKLDLDVDNVGLDSLARSYGLSSPFRWGSVSADAEVSGNLNTLKGTAEFSLPTATTPIFGQANLDQNTLNSTIQIAEGNVNIKAQRNAQNFNANVNASQVALEPLVNAGLLFANLDPNLKSDLARVDVSDGRLNLTTNLSGSLDNLNPSALQGASDVNINLGGQSIDAIAQIRQGNFSANFETDPLSLTRLREIGLTVAEIPSNTQTQIQDLDLQNGTVKAEGTVRGNLNNLENVVGKVSTLVNLGNTGGVVQASGRLTGDLFQADLDTSTLPLLPLIDLGLPFANLPPDINRQIQSLDLRNGNLEARALFSGNINNLAAITGTANSQINLGNFGGNIDARGQLTDGQFQASVSTDPIPLEPLVDLGLPLANLPSDLNREIQRINLRNGGLQGQASVVGNIANLNPTQLTANVNGLVDLGQDGGQVKLTGQALRGQWQTIINADQIALNRFSDLVESQTRGILDPLQDQGLITQAEAMPLLRGLLNTRLRGNGSLIDLKPEAIRAMARLELTELPIIKQPLEAAFNWNGQGVEIERLQTPQFGADGFVAVEFSGTGVLEVSNLNVDIRLSDFDLQSPLVQRVLPDLPPDLTQDSPLLAGIVNFDGNVSGSLSTLAVNGDLSLSNLVVRDLVFDPLLSGPVSAGLNQGVNVALKGEQDRIELALNDRYLPESFLIRQGEAIAQGETIGGDLAVTLEQFPLNTLSLAPLADQGFGEIDGIASANLSISELETLDPFQIGVKGQVAVDRPALGYLDLDRFQANLNLNDGQFQLTEGEVRRGETEILIAARANLEEILADLQAGVTPFSSQKLETPPDFEADIKIPNGTLQDVLEILEYYNLSDLARGISTPEYGTAADVNPFPVGLPPTANLTQQLQRLEEIQALLKRQVDEEKENPLPPLEAVRGSFTGDISVQGSIAAGVIAKVELENKGDWTWGRYKADEFLLEATLDQNNVVRVLPLQLISDETIYDFRGAFALDTQKPSGQFRIKNIRLERVQKELEKFVELPNIDVNGQLNFRANLAGSLENPQATGEFTVVDGIFNQAPINEARGSFSYNNARLFLGSTILLTEEDPIRIKATVPYRLPFAEVAADSSFLQAEIDIKDEGFNIIDLVNPEVDWVKGTGLVSLKVQGNLEQDENGQISSIFVQPEGLLKLQDGVISIDSINQSIVGLSGTAAFISDRITVSSIKGELVGEAGSGNISIEGVLPIFQPLPEGESDFDSIYIELDNLKVGIETLYTGKAAGLIAIGGTVLRPEIGGGITIEEGTVLLPMGAASGDAGGGGGLPSTGPIKISLDDFRVTLGEGIQIETPPVNEFLSVPIVDFTAEGTLTLNGRLESLDDIRPSGTIELTNGALNLYTTRFSLDRGYPQQAIFLPSEGIIPILDLRLVTRVAETTRFQAPTSAFSSEISEVPSASTLGTVRTIRVTALVRGPASQINDIVQLKSSPSRSKTQLISLLGGSAIAGITGDSTLILANIASAGLFNQIQQNVLDATGLTEFRIYPARISENGGSTESSTLGLGLEVGLDVTDNVSVSLSQVLADEQPTQLGVNYRVNDNLLIRGATGFNSESEIRFEYEVQF